MEVASQRVKSLPPYLFAEFARKKSLLESRGIDVIDLGIGSPDLPPPPFISQKMANEMLSPENHRYSPFGGCTEFKEAVAAFYRKRYGVSLDPAEEVLALIGSKEGISNLMHAMIDPGDGVLLPDPGYPVYQSSVHLSGGTVLPLPLDKKGGFIPDYRLLPEAILKKAKLMLLNYPANPTAATVNLQVYKDAVQFAEKNDLFIANDAAYDLLTFGNYQSPSLLQAPNSKERCIEFGSLSKSFNMSGWRIGYAVGNKEIIRALATLKSNTDTCQFLPIQKAAAAALNSDLSAAKEHSLVYEIRMKKLLPALRSIGMDTDLPRGSMFLWSKVPEGYGSLEFANRLLDEAGIIVTPGTAFGESGEGYVRIALTVDERRLEEVIARLKNLNI